MGTILVSPYGLIWVCLGLLWAPYGRCTLGTMCVTPVLSYMGLNWDLYDPEVGFSWDELYAAHVVGHI